MIKTKKYERYYTVNIISYIITIYLYIHILCIIFDTNKINLIPYIHNHHIYCKYTYMINVFMVGSENPPHLFKLPHLATTKNAEIDLVTMYQTNF